MLGLSNETTIVNNTSWKFFDFLRDERFRERHICGDLITGRHMVLILSQMLYRVPLNCHNFLICLCLSIRRQAIKRRKYWECIFKYPVGYKGMGDKNTSLARLGTFLLDFTWVWEHILMTKCTGFVVCMYLVLLGVQIYS